MWVIPSKVDTEFLTNTKDALERYIGAPYQTFGKPVYSYFKNVDASKKNKTGFSKQVHSAYSNI